MTQSTFFRLLKTPIDDKGDALAAQIAALNETGEAEETYTLDPADFSLIPNSPFAYWATESVFRIFREIPPAEGNVAAFRLGLTTNDDFRFLRLSWEVSPGTIGPLWRCFSKGGAYSPYYYDVHLLLDWEDNAERLRQYCRERGDSPSRNIRSESLYFHPGLTWPRRTQKGLNLRAMPVGCIFADKGPVAFVGDNNIDELLALLAVMNSLAFQALVELQMAFGSYEVGVIQRTPVPLFTDHASRITLAALAREAHDLQRDRDRTDETTHAFCLPALVLSSSKDGQPREVDSLLEASLALEAETQAAQSRLADIQAEIDDLVFDLYGLGEADRALVRAEMGALHHASRFTPSNDEDAEPENEPDEGKEPTPPEDLPARVQNLLMWCVGVAFGRWDVRMALDPTLVPALQGPFDPLPRRAPGALVGPDGLPASKDSIASEPWLRARENVLDLPPSSLQGEGPGMGVYPRPIAWDGILVDDPTHPADIVTRVRQVLALLWGDRADAIECEACDTLGVNGLRDYFRDPRQGFFAFHIKRYSKSRRKAPIYWLLQSEKRNYALWLYYHRLTPDTLFVAGRDYADAKVALEQARLEELRQGLASLSGAARRRREREIERQQKLVAEVTDFRNQLDRVALLKLPPDPNDGVVISIAPLWELVPWREAQRTWEKLTAGEYLWSTMAQQMRERGIVKRKR